MSPRHAFLAMLFLAAGAAGVRAQEPIREPRPERLRQWVVPRYRFDFRVPRMTMRVAPRIRIDTDRIRMQALERSRFRMDRARELMDRVRDRQFEMRNRQFEMQNRQLELRSKLREVRPRIETRVMERMHERMNIPYKVRPFTHRRRYRDI